MNTHKKFGLHTEYLDSKTLIKPNNTLLALKLIELFIGVKTYIYVFTLIHTVFTLYKTSI